MYFSDSHFQADTLLRRHILICIVAICLFLLLLFLGSKVSAVAALDRTLSEGVQGMRSAALDRAMIVITLLADVEVAGWIALLVLLYLLTARHWWLALHLSCVILGAVWTVVLLKNLLGRARPLLPNGSLEGFSLPSGHACTAMLMSGILAVLLARSCAQTTRWLLFACAGIFSSLVAFSRVYLLAHWPSDVLAGLCLGLCLVCAFSWQLHINTLKRDTTLLPKATGSVVLIASIHLITSLEAKLSIYGLDAN